MRPLLLAVTLSAGLPVLAQSADQSLAEVSRKAEAARNAAPRRPAAKVYTNKDLPAVAQPSPAPVATSASAPAPVTPAPPSAGQLPPGATDEAYWRNRMRPLRERLDSARALADDTQRRAETLMRSADRCFAIGIVCADYTESLRLTDAHKALVADVARAERDVAALEDEARRANVPPGWLRE